MSLLYHGGKMMLHLSLGLDKDFQMAVDAVELLRERPLKTALQMP